MAAGTAKSLGLVPIHHFPGAQRYHAEAPGPVYYRRHATAMVWRPTKAGAPKGSTLFLATRSAPLPPHGTAGSGRAVIGSVLSGGTGSSSGTSGTSGTSGSAAPSTGGNSGSGGLMGTVKLTLHPGSDSTGSGSASGTGSTSGG